MIVVDTSALMAIVLDEAASSRCVRALENEDEVLIFAGTVAEALIVAARRDLAEPMSMMIEGLGFTIVPVSGSSARRIEEAYSRWGKGVHPAGLNFGDCFAYALAKEQGCRLLYVGDDFAKTDIEAVAA